MGEMEIKEAGKIAQAKADELYHAVTAGSATLTFTSSNGVHNAAMSAGDFSDLSDGDMVTLKIKTGDDGDDNSGTYLVSTASGANLKVDRRWTEAPLTATAANLWSVKKIQASPCVVTETVKGTSENWECSGRGICDAQTGLCECFEGYTNDDCSTQTVIV